MKYVYLAIAFSILWLSSHSQNTVGLLTNEESAYPGISMLTLKWYDVILINNCGEVLNYWDGHFPLKTSALLPNGNLFKNGNALINTSLNGTGGAGALEIVDWDNNHVWSYTYVEDYSHIGHHDAEPLPNGNILVVAWEYHSQQEALDNGRDPNSIFFNSLWPTQIAEIQPIGSDSINIPWLWSTWDHMVQDRDSTKVNYVENISDAPHRLDINFFDGDPDDDWMHTNSVSYNPELDVIAFGSRVLMEIFVIDHSTSAIEVKGSEGGNFGKGGDFLWRWGNPQSHGMGTAADKQLFSQHGVRWIDAGKPDEGKIIVFNNGIERPGPLYSTIEIIEPTMNASKTEFIYDPIDGFGPETYHKSYTPAPDNPTDFFAAIGCSAMQLPNGNIYVSNNMDGYVFELDSSNNVVWYYQKPVTDLSSDTLPQGTIIDQNMGIGQFESLKYSYDYPGFDGRDLTPLGIISHPDDPEPDSCYAEVPFVNFVEPLLMNEYSIYPNPSNNVVYISSYGSEISSIQIVDLLSRTQNVSYDRISSEKIMINTSDLVNGVYILQIKCADNTLSSDRILKL